MTSDIINNVIVDSGGENELTIYTTEVKHNVTKSITLIKASQAPQNAASGPKDNKIVDLLRIEDRYTITGSVALEDITKYRNLIKQSGVITVLYDNLTLTMAIDKAEDVKRGNDDPFREVTLSVVVGVDFTA